MANTEFKRKINRRTFLLLSLVMLAVLGFSLGFGLAAGNGSFSASAAGLRKDDSDNQVEWDKTTSKQAYDTSRTVTVEPGVEKTISGLYLLNPKGTIMPAKNNHLHIQVNFTYNAGSWDGSNYTTDANNYYTYKYSFKDTQALGNNGAGQTDTLYYPREANDDTCLFKIVYVPDDVTFSLKLIFNTMTPTGEGTFDIRYFGHPSKIDSCDYVSGYNTAQYGAGGAVTDAANDSYYYFDYNYNRGICKKQVLQVKVEKQYNAGAADNGLPVLKSAGYQDSGINFVADASYNVTPASTMLYPYTLLNVTNDPITGGNTYRDYNATYSFVEGTFQATRNAAGGGTETFKLSDYFTISYVPYVQNLRANRHPNNDISKEPVPSTYKNGADPILTAGTSASHYFNNALAIKIEPKGNLFDLYGYTIYCSATIKRFGHSMTLQSTAKFTFTVTDTVVQNVSSYDGATIGDNVDFYTLTTKKAGGSNLTLDVNDIVSYAKNATNLANQRFQFVDFPEDVPGAVPPTNPGIGATGTNAIRYCGNVESAVGIDCSGEGGTSHPSDKNKTDYDKVIDTTAANGFGISADGSKLTLVRAEDSKYVGKLYVLVCLKDTHSVSGKTYTLCVRLDVPSEGIAIRDLTDMADQLTNKATATTGTPATTHYPVTVNRASNWFLQGNTDAVKLSLSNYLYQKGFDFGDAASYKTSADGGKREYGVAINAEYFYTPVTGTATIKFIAPEGSGIELDKAYNTTIGSDYYSWLLGSDGVLYVYPNKATVQLSEPFRQIPAFDVAMEVNGADKVFRRIQFNVAVGNTAPNATPKQSLQTLQERDGVKWDSNWTNPNAIHLIADSTHGYNVYKGLSGGDAVHNNNPYNLSEYFAWNVMDWVNDNDLPATGAPVANYDSIRFIIATSGAYAIGWDYNSKAELQVLLEDGTTWMSVQAFVSAGKTDKVTKIRFYAKSQLTAMPCSIYVRDDNGGATKLTFYVSVEDSKPYYAADADAIHSLTTVAESDNDSLYRNSVTFNPLLLRTTPIDTSATVVNFMDWSLTDKNGGTKNYDFYSAFKGVARKYTYNVNKLLVDPDGDAALGFALSQNGSDVAFKVSATGVVFDNGGEFFATGSSGQYRADITVGGKTVATVTFRNAAAGTEKIGDITLEAKDSVADTIHISFQVSANGSALTPGTEAVHTYGFDFALLSSLPTAAETTTVDTLKQYSTGNDAKVFTAGSALGTDGIITSDDTRDAGKWFFIPEAQFEKFPYLQYLYYPATGDPQWVDVKSLDAYIKTDSTALATATDYDFHITYDTSAQTISVMANRNREDKKTLSVRFFVTNLGFGVDGYKYDGKADTDILSIATPVTYNFMVKQAGLSGTGTPVDVKHNSSNWGGDSTGPFSGADYAAFYKVDLKGLVKAVKEDGSDDTDTDLTGKTVTFYYKNEYTKNFSLPYNSKAKDHLLFTGENGTPLIGKIDGGVYTGPAKADIILNFDNHQIWVKPLNRTLYDADGTNPLDWFDFNLMLTIDRGDSGGSNGLMGEVSSNVQVRMTIADAEFTLDSTDIDYTSGNTGKYDPNLFNLDGSGIVLSVADGSVDKNTVFPANGDLDLIVKAYSEARGQYYDLNDTYFLALPDNIPAALKCTGEGRSITVGGKTYYEKIHVVPQAKANGVIALPLTVIDCLYVNDANQSVTAGHAKAMTVKFSIADSSITASNTVNQLNIVGRTVFEQDGSKEVIGPHSESNHDLPEWVFCDGETDYKKVNTVEDFGGSKMLSDIFKTKDGAVDGNKLFTNVYGVLSVKFYVAKPDGSADMAQPIAGKDITAEALTDLVAGSKTLENGWVSISFKDQKISIELLSRSGMEQYADGVVGILTYASSASDSASKANYAFRLQTVANTVIVKKDAARRVAFTQNGNSLTTSINISDFVYNFNGDKISYTETSFADENTAFRQLYRDYVTKNNDTNNIGNLLVQVKKMHRTYGDVTKNHAQEYPVVFTLQRHAEGTTTVVAEGMPASVTVTCYYDDTTSKPTVNSELGKINGNDKNELLYEDAGFDNLYCLQTAAGRSDQPNSFELYAADTCYIADPTSDDTVVTETKGTADASDKKWVIGSVPAATKNWGNVLNFVDLGTAAVYDNTGNAVSSVNASSFVDVRAITTFKGKTLDSRQVFGVSVRALRKLPDNQFIRLTFVVKDTTGNALTVGSESGKVQVDLRIVNSITQANTASTLYESETETYKVILQSAREAWEKVSGEGHKPDRDLPAGQTVSLQELISDGDFNYENYTVYVDGAPIGHSMDSLYTKTNANHDVVYKMGYDAASKSLVFYSFKWTAPVAIPDLEIVSDTGDRVKFSATGAGTFSVDIPDSLPIELTLDESQKVFTLQYGQYTNVALSDYLYDYDGDPIERHPDFDGANGAYVTINGTRYESTSEEFKKYFTVTNNDFGVLVRCKGLLREPGLGERDEDNVILYITLKYTSQQNGQDVLRDITLHSVYKNDAPVFSKRQLPNSNYDMKYDSGILTITYTGADAQYGKELIFDLDSFIDLNAYFGSQSFAIKQYLTVNGKRVEGERDGKSFYTVTIDDDRVGEKIVGAFAVTDSLGNNPVFLQDDGSKSEIRSISFSIVVANSDPEAMPDFKEDGTEKEREVLALAPGETVTFGPKDLVTDVNSTDVLQFVPEMSQEGGVTTYDEDVPLKGAENPAFTAKYVATNGVYDKIEVTVDDSYDVASAQNVVIESLRVRDNHAGSRPVVIRNVTVTVVLKPSQAIAKTSGKGESVAEKNDLTAYLGIPMSFDVVAEMARKENSAMASKATAGSSAVDVDFDKDYKYTTLVNPKELFGDTYGKYITVTDIAPGEGYTVNKNDKTVTVDYNYTGDNGKITLPITFQSGKTEETVSVTVSLSEPESLKYQGLPSLEASSTPAKSSKSINIGDLAVDPHGQKISIVSVLSGDPLLLKAEPQGDNAVLLTPLASGSVTVTVKFKVGDNPNRLYDQVFSMTLSGYPAVSLWDKLMQNPIYLWIAGAALFVILLIIILLIAKHSRKKRLMKELETMLMAEMEADEQLKLDGGGSMMNMPPMGGMYNPNQLGAGMSPGGYDPNMLQLGSGQSQMQDGYDPNQFNQFGGGSQMQGGYDPNQFNQFGGGSQMQGGYDPNQFNQFGGGSQMQGGFDPNQFNQGGSQFGSGDSYIDLDDFNDNK